MTPFLLAAAAKASSNANTSVGAGQLLRVAISLGVVFLIMWGAVKVLRKRGVSFGGKRSGTRGATSRSRSSDTEVVARQGLTRSSSVALVRVGEQFLVLGATDSSVTLLARGDREAFGLPAPERAAEVRTPVAGYTADTIDVVPVATGTTGSTGSTSSADLEVARTAPRDAYASAPAWKMFLDTMKDRTVRSV